MSEFPYAAYYDFFATWFNNIFFISFAFLLWVAITHWAFFMKGRTLLLRLALALLVTSVCYLIFGLLIAGGRFGGQAEFFYDSTIFKDNLFVHGGLQGILLWPLFLFPTGGIWIVLIFIVLWLGFRYSHNRIREKAAG